MLYSLSENGFFIAKKENITPRVKETADRLSAMTAAGMDPDRWEERKQGFADGLLDYEIFATKKSRFFLKPYTPGDENHILALFEQSFFTQRSVQHWEWKYKENPFGSLKIALAVDEEGILAAHYAGYPVPFWLAGGPSSSPEEFLAYQNGDTMTRQKFRNVGLGKTSLLARTFTYFIAKFAEDFLSFYYGFNTDRIKILGKRYMGYNYIDPVLFRKRDLKTRPFREPGAFKRFFGGYSVEEVKGVDAEWDDFFLRAAPHYGLLVRRDSRYLQWRYLECPDRIHKIFAVRKRKRLVGWSVFSRKEKKLVWGDALFDKNSLESLNFLLYEVAKAVYPRTESIEAWFPPHPEWWDRKLDEAGFSRSPEPRGLTPCAQHNPYHDRRGPSPVERERHRFYYTMGDSDLF